MSESDWKKLKVPSDTAAAVNKALESFAWNQWSEQRPDQCPSGGRAPHSSESISSTIATLESLAETLPAVLTVANGWAPADIKFTNRHAMLSAIDMLRRYREMRRAEADAARREHEARVGSDQLQGEAAILAQGVAAGIEQERNRAKEVRKGRKRST